MIVARLQEGQSCALVSDAGMPAISDPGETLVAACAQAEIPVYVVPGPTAATLPLLSTVTTAGLLEVNWGWSERTRSPWSGRPPPDWAARHRLQRLIALVGGDEKILRPRVRHRDQDRGIAPTT